MQNYEAVGCTPTLVNRPCSLLEIELYAADINYRDRIVEINYIISFLYSASR
jgi:hypothetical protein